MNHSHSTTTVRVRPQVEFVIGSNQENGYRVYFHAIGRKPDSLLREVRRFGLHWNIEDQCFLVPVSHIRPFVSWAHSMGYDTSSLSGHTTTLWTFDQQEECDDE